MPRQKPQPPALLTIREAAAYTGTSVQNIWRAIKCGRLTLASSAYPARVVKAALDVYLATKGPRFRPAGWQKGDKAREIREIRKAARESLSAPKA